MSDSNPRLTIDVFDGAIKVLRILDPKRAFNYSVTFNLSHPHLRRLALADKPPMHFHPHQEEYIEVMEGALGVEVENIKYKLTPQDGKLVIQPWANHRLYPLLGNAADGDAAGGGITKFLLSGEKSREVFELDDVFFQNWYGYQDEVLMQNGRFDLIQVMNMFDAGGSYLAFPAWIPFDRRLAQITGIVVGRWLGGMLGYQPFHRKWTTDWPLAVAKMRASIFLSRFARDLKND